MLLISLVISLLLHPGNKASPVMFERRADPSAPSALSTYTPTRSAYNIVWSCVITTFLCAWVSIHPRIPRVKGGSWEKAGTRLVMFMQIILAPEFGVAWAAEERKMAREIKGEIGRRGFRITTSHAHFLKMGGFDLCFPEKEVRELLKIDGKTVPESSGTNDETGEVSKELRDKEAEVDRGSVADEELIELRYIETLTPERFMQLLDNRAIEFPLISKGEIQDRSKTDGLARLITAIQVLWFVVQCIVRYIQRLAITQLEVTTLALACLNAHLLWSSRDKPQNVGIPVPLYLLEGSDEWEKWKAEWDVRKANWKTRKEELEREQREEQSRPKWQRLFLPLWKCVLNFWRGVFSSENWRRFHAGFRRLDPKETRRGAAKKKALILPLFPRGVAVQAAIVGSIFGALHCAGWNFTFPSGVERHSWRALALTLTVCPIFFTFAGVLDPAYRMADMTLPHILVGISFLVFLTARYWIIFLAIALLREQPPSAYLAVSWTRLFPHPSG